MFVGTGKSRKPEERARARELRREGWSYKRIAGELGVSPSSALYWTRDIELTPEQAALNSGKGYTADGEVVNARAKAWAEKCRERRRAFQNAGRARAHEDDPSHRALCMLYWAEGAKNKNTVKFANSDTPMVRMFVRAVRAEFSLPAERFTASVNVYLGNGHTLEAIEDHWLKNLDLPQSCLRKGIVNHFPTSSSGAKRNKLPYGVCTVTVTRSTAIVQHIFGAIQEYGGFEEPRWLG